ncbi:hypothetical protein PTTG_03032 [Puccinia triticina 1-1 BBBD Race 1]|uniref:Uncharacterized protein n=1 Tax=Puccinia triticina (isolate 1-1 / race 1 (BBBD)) TaxID=630390 RepID=A0A0C4EQH3_PUCT1|nr:hypothetical protein PTTG_03032 [Puccinia triticina 1-1 BBBD Race 1]
MESNHPFLARNNFRPSDIQPNQNISATKNTVPTTLPHNINDFVNPSLFPSHQPPQISPATAPVGSALPNKTLRELQHTHIKYTKLNQAIKVKAQNIYFEYQRQQHLLLLKYSHPFSALTKYLRQRRTRQQESFWDSFRKNDPDVQKALHNTKNSIGKRNKEVSKLYKLATAPNNSNTSGEPKHQPDPTDASDTAKREVFDKISKSSKQLQTETRNWAEGVQLKMKEISNLFVVEGLLVLAGQDHSKPFFFQGGSMYGVEFLKGLIDEGDLMHQFAIWTARQKKVLETLILN